VGASLRAFRSFLGINVPNIFSCLNSFCFGPAEAYMHRVGRVLSVSQVVGIGTPPPL
jgi:hypothetical protein